MKKTTLFGIIFGALAGFAGTVAVIATADAKRKKTACPECMNEECPVEKRSKAVKKVVDRLDESCTEACAGAKVLGEKTKKASKKLFKKLKKSRKSNPVEELADTVAVDDELYEQLTFDLDVTEDEDVADITSEDK